MAPKLRRPAAAPRPAAKAAPRIGRLQRRRPSARVEERGVERPGEPEAGGVSLEERWLNHEGLEASSVPLTFLGEGSGVIAEGTYWGAACQVSGIIMGMRVYVQIGPSNFISDPTAPRERIS